MSTKREKRDPYLWEALISILGLVLFISLAIVRYETDAHVPILLGVLVAAVIGLRAGYSDSYARKLSARFARDERLRRALHARMRRLLDEAGESDRVIVERILQRRYMDEHPKRATYLTGTSPFGPIG